MDKESLHNYCEEGLSTRGIAGVCGIGQTTVRYWLKKYDLKTSVPLSVHKCSLCGEDDPSKFYGNKKYRCGDCHNKYTIAKARESKRKAVIYKGGGCAECGYNKCIAALEFHHINSKEKDPNFGKMKNWKFERIKEELDKCVLLCANCHREEHYQTKFLMEE